MLHVSPLPSGILRITQSAEMEAYTSTGIHNVDVQKRKIDLISICEIPHLLLPHLTGASKVADFREPAV